MNNIFSKIEKQKIMHIIYRKNEIIQARQNIIPENEFLQLSSLNLNKGVKFKPHYHIFKNGKDNVIAQESWVVIQGKVKVFLYDVDNTVLYEDVLEQGDCSITLYGGHTYEILEDNTLVYEYKTGPYEGQELDKRFIE
jgi:hypothetical protein